MARKARGPRQTLIQASRRVPPVEKAAFQQFGSGRRKREFFGLSDDDQKAIVDKIRDGIAKNLRG
jgi:hypothetical protein